MFRTIKKISINEAESKLHSIEIFRITPPYPLMIHYSGKHQVNMHIWFQCGIQYYRYNKAAQEKLQLISLLIPEQCAQIVSTFEFTYARCIKVNMCHLNHTSPAYFVFCPSFALPYCTSPREPYSPALLVFRDDPIFFLVIFFPFLSSSFPSTLASGWFGVTNGSKLALISCSLESVELTKKFAVCANLLDFLNSGLACFVE